MQPEQIEKLIKEGMPDADAYVEGDGTHFNALVISPAFKDCSRIKRQQMVYATVKKFLEDGSLHALSLRTLTPEEWQDLEAKQ